MKLKTISTKTIRARGINQWLKTTRKEKGKMTEKITWDSSVTEKTLQVNNKSLGELESQGVSICKPSSGTYSRIKPKTKLGLNSFLNLLFNFLLFFMVLV